MSTLLRLAAIMTLAGSIPACGRITVAPSPVAATDSAALRAEIERLNREMEQAVARGDLLAAAAYYADDAVVGTPTSTVAQGRAEVDRYFTSITNAKSWRLEVRRVSGTRDVAYQVGRSTLVHGAPERTSVVDFFLVWRRQPDGRLRIAYDYYHRAER